MESKFKQDVLEGRVWIRVSVGVRWSEQRSDGRLQSMVIYSRIAWRFSQVWRSVGDSWVDGNWRSVRDRCWRNAWQTLLTFDEGLAISSMRKEKKMDGGGKKKNVKALFLNVFLNEHKSFWTGIAISFCPKATFVRFFGANIPQCTVG